MSSPFDRQVQLCEHLSDGSRFRDETFELFDGDCADLRANPAAEMRSIKAIPSDEPRNVAMIASGWAQAELAHHIR
jgi:hypothetical protein